MIFLIIYCIPSIQNENDFREINVVQKNPVSLISDFFMENYFETYIESPVGILHITTDKKFLLSISFVNTAEIPSLTQPDIIIKVVLQLKEYFSGLRKTFDINLNPVGTEFQNKVWNQVKDISFGKTASYLEIAIKTGSKNNTRAVGLANGKNPIPIIIPCHRIIGTNGKLIGYTGGIEKKRCLLQHELNYSIPSELLF